MNKRYYVIALFISLILLVSACKQSGAAAGTAPRTPFIGGTAGVTINFEKDSPPPEVIDQDTFPFNVIVRLKNDGEFKVERENIKLNLIGFDPESFGIPFSALKDINPQDTLDSKNRDAEGNIVEGTTTFATFPSSGEFQPQTLSGNTEFTFRADVCYYYTTLSNTKLCVLRDMINVRDDNLCKPNGAKTTYSSSAPVQVTNFRQSVVGKDKISFSFDVVLNGNVDIFWKKSSPATPSRGFDQACPRDPKDRREAENSVSVTLREVPLADRVFENLKCGSLDSNIVGVVRLVSGKRTITCTADLRTDRVDLEKVVQVELSYNVLDNKETKVLVKHLART